MSRRTRSGSAEDQPAKRSRTTLEILNETAAKLLNKEDEGDDAYLHGWSPVRIFRIPER